MSIGHLDEFAFAASVLDGVAQPSSRAEKRRRRLVRAGPTLATSALSLPVVIEFVQQAAVDVIAGRNLVFFDNRRPSYMNFASAVGGLSQGSLDTCRQRRSQRSWTQ